MKRYIDADRICAEIKQLKEKYPSWQLKLAMDDLHDFIDSLQQDETQVDKILCSQAWWLEQGWIMIPPNATIEGIDSLLRQVKKKLQLEQPELPGYDKALLDVKSKVDELYEEASIGLSEYDSGLYNGIAETCMKLRGFIKARLHSDEQPDVDFETEYAKFSNDPDALDYAFPIDLADYKDFAHHFYELGRNARKED